MIGLRTLVLNADYSPISVMPLHTIPVEDAVTRVINGTCHQVENYERKILTPNLDMYWPSVIARNEYINVPRTVNLRRESLFYRDRCKCSYCDKPLTVSKVTYDHYIPKKRGGRKEWENIVCACMSCNVKKSDSEPVGEWTPRQKPFRPHYFQLVNNRKKHPLYLQHITWVPYFPEWENDIIVAAHGEKPVIIPAGTR